MATYSFPALGFDPARGDPDAIEAVARDCERSAQDLGADADLLKRLTGTIDWQGEAADTFATHPARLYDDLSWASSAYGGTGSALRLYAATLRQAKHDACRLEEEAAEAKMRADRHSTEFDRLSQDIARLSPETSTVDQAMQLENARRLQTSAQDHYDAVVARARRLQQVHEEAGNRAASQVRALSDAPYQDVGLVSHAVGSAADWVSAHADGLRAVSDVLKRVSAIAGALSFIPVLTPILAPIAGITAVGALTIDASLVATGHGDCKALAVDAVLMALPGAGKLASEVVLASRARRLVVQDANALQALSSKVRPSTVAILLTRNRGLNVFRGASRGIEVTHPKLLEALHEVPTAIRTDYHGKCAEMRAVEQALREGAHLKGAVITTARVRPPHSIVHGTPHLPCDSCAHVLRQFNIKFRG